MHYHECYVIILIPVSRWLALMNPADADRNTNLHYPPPMLFIITPQTAQQYKSVCQSSTLAATLAQLHMFWKTCEHQSEVDGKSGSREQMTKGKVEMFFLFLGGKPVRWRWCYRSEHSTEEDEQQDCWCACFLFGLWRLSEVSALCPSNLIWGKALVVFRGFSYRWSWVWLILGLSWGGLLRAISDFLPRKWRKFVHFLVRLLCLLIK